MISPAYTCLHTPNSGGRTMCDSTVARVMAIALRLGEGDDQS
jgi:hypothetical protein